MSKLCCEGKQGNYGGTWGYALGTMPLLFGFGTFVTLLSNKFRNRLIKLGLIFVLLLAFMMFVRGIRFIILNS